LQDLTLDEVADARFGHDGDGDGGHYFGDELGVGHADDAALGADVGGDALEGHYGGGAGFFGDACLEGGALVEGGDGGESGVRGWEELAWV